MSEYRLLPIEKRRSLHPLWYALGCWLLVLLALMSYGLTMWLIQQNAKYGWVPIPGPGVLPPWMLRLGLTPKVIVTWGTGLVVFLLLLGIVSTVYAILMRLFGYRVD